VPVTSPLFALALGQRLLHTRIQPRGRAGIADPNVAQRLNAKRGRKWLSEWPTADQLGEIVRMDLRLSRWRRWRLVAGQEDGQYTRGSNECSGERTGRSAELRRQQDDGRATTTQAAKRHSTLMAPDTRPAPSAASNAARHTASTARIPNR
jgi:hypothetical protein